MRSFKHDMPRKRTDSDDNFGFDEQEEIKRNYVIGKNEIENSIKSSLYAKSLNYGDGGEFDTFDVSDEETSRSTKTSTKRAKTTDQEYSLSAPIMPKTELFCRRCLKWINLA